MLICILAGVGIDHLVPAIGNVGVLVGGALGFAAAIYVMVTGLRAYINSEPPAPRIQKRAAADDRQDPEERE